MRVFRAEKDFLLAVCVFAQKVAEATKPAQACKDDDVTKRWHTLSAAARLRKIVMAVHAYANH